MFQRFVAKRAAFLLAASVALCTSALISLPSEAQSWGQLKDAAQEAQGKKDYAVAAESWNRALEASGGSGARYTMSLAGLAKCYSEANKFAEAEATYKKIAESSTSASISDEGRQALRDYSNWLKKENREADATALDSKFVLNATPALPPAASSSASSSSVNGKDANAKQAFQQDFAAWETLFKNGSVELAKKNYPAADKLLKEALLIAEKYGNTQSMSSSTLASLDASSFAQGKNTEGEDYSLRMVAAVRLTKGPLSSEFAKALNNHAVWLRRLNRKAEAMAEERKADAIVAKLRPSSEPATGASNVGYITPGTSGPDPSATRSGGLRNRARAAQSGFTGRVNDMVNSMD